MRVKELKRKIALIMGVLLITLSFSGIALKSYATTFATVHINLSDNGITVNGEPITEDSSQIVYLAHSTNNGGTSTDAQNANIAIDNIVVIRGCGVFEFTGSLSNGQIAVDFNELTGMFESAGHVGIALNNASITCKSAPVILAYNKDVAFEGKELYIQTVSGTTNTLTGGKIKEVVQNWSDNNNLKYYVENDADEGLRYKYDGAISSDVSVGFGGDGNLIINSSKKEGIESKANVEIGSGNITINSLDDGINASTDHKSTITINGGSVLVNVLSEAEEGDGIDSNGTVVINGGTVVALACEKSADNGLDSDDGIYINGGYVAATGSMADGINSGSKQKYLQKTLTNKVSKDTLITITDKQDNPLAAFKADRSYSVLTISTPEITTEDVTIYEGGTIDGEETNGLYTKINLYAKGKERTDIGQMGMRGGPQEFGDRNMQRGQEATQDFKVYYIVLGVLGFLLIVVIIVTVIGAKKAKKE